MKTKYRLLILVLFALGLSHTSALKGQVTLTEEQKQIDSFQRVVMRDSLKISDLQITRVFEIKNDYFKETNAVLFNESLNAFEQQSNITAVRRKTNESINTLLGPVIYQKYIEMIRNKMSKINAKDSALASE